MDMYCRGDTLSSMGRSANSEKDFSPGSTVLLLLLWDGVNEKRLDNKGEEKGENPLVGVEHSESLSGFALPCIFFFFLRLLDKKSSLGVPKEKLAASSMFEKKLEYDEVAAEDVAG
jgi:hypothetical protein